MTGRPVGVEPPLGQAVEQSDGAGDPPRFGRRAWIGGTAALGLQLGCRRSTSPTPPITGTIAGDLVDRGHRLGRPAPPASGAPERRRVVVVGAGVAGLSAAWRLRAAGVEDALVLDLGRVPGGTAQSGLSTHGPCPWGAHYLPVPNPETVVTQRFLRQIGLMSGPDTAPRFEERHLVFEPEDRLFYRGAWYDGLYLRAGASRGDLAEHDRFHADMARLRAARGSDGRLGFTLPTALASRDPAFTALDSLTMAAWMEQQGYRSERLRWLVDYACRDDYGAGVAEVSAWAGIHYFAGRRSWETPETRGSHYFTWPEGNARLIEALRTLAGEVRCDRTVLAVTPAGAVTGLDADGAPFAIQAESVVLATPSHVTGHLLGRKPFASHAPWLVANLALRRRPERDTGAWNNVLYDGAGLGYVDAGHQSPDFRPETTFTYYRALPRAERRWLLEASYDALAEVVLKDLRRAHPDLDDCVDRLDVWRWGHGTLVPEPGVQFGPARAAFLAPAGALHLAHTDLSGLPFFEEAQYRGVLAAEAVLASLGVAHGRWAEV